MTREEAIYRLKNMAWLYGSAEREQNIEAIDMAIEALSADAVDYGEYILKADDRLGADVIYCSPEIAENVKVVVRCKDCIYRGKENGLYWCSHEEGLVGDATDNDYCSYGERKE